MSCIQENTNTCLKEIAKTIQDLKSELNKETAILKRTQAKLKIEQKNSITQLKRSRDSLTSRMDQREDRMSGLEDIENRPEKAKNMEIEL